MWVTTSFVKCDSSPSCAIQEKVCDKMEMEGGCQGVKYGVFQNEPGRVIRLSVSHRKKTIKLKGMNMCNELSLSLVHVSISFVLFSVNK